ncbi:MAG: response regulator [Ardenticatenaceae bacterium]|nr:response regulator [Ardenticatenaceae bacterium]
MDVEDIRKKAEALLKEDHPKKDMFSDEDLSQILHELRVHQVELELQNEELRRIQGDLQAARRKYFDLFNLAPVGYFSFNRQGHIIELNLTASQLLGHGRNYLLGKPLIPYLTRENHSVFFTHLDAVFISKERQQCELQIRMLSEKEQKEIHVRVDSIAVREDDDWLCLSTVIDISQQKLLEAELLRNQKLEAVGLLAGGIAHDFNNLLTGLFGNIELAKAFLSANDKAYNYLKSAMWSLERATDLTNQLLTFAKGGDPIKETLPIGKIVAEMASFSLRGSNAKLRTNISSDLWLAEVDKGQLGQVISNLAINAQQAMPTGGVISLSAENIIVSGDRYVKIIVRDEGTGIAPKYIDKIFDPYFSTKHNGSGLGLAISHSIISKHNGRITVSSHVNQGTEFSIYLPAAVVDTSFAMKEEHYYGDTAPLKTARILVLDDEAAVREVLGAALEQIGHRVEFAVEGQEAVTKYQEAHSGGVPFQVAILDLTIPGHMGGAEVAQRILAFDPDAKLVVSSGYATDSTIANYEAHGFQARIVKPFSLTDLRKVVEQVLAEPQ